MHILRFVFSLAWNYFFKDDQKFSTRNMPTGKLPARKKKSETLTSTSRELLALGFLTRSPVGLRVKNPNASEAIYKSKLMSYMRTKLFFVGIFHRSFMKILEGVFRRQDYCTHSAPLHSLVRNDTVM